jgi:hypothetical protein
MRLHRDRTSQPHPRRNTSRAYRRIEARRPRSAIPERTWASTQSRTLGSRVSDLYGVGAPHVDIAGARARGPAVAHQDERPASASSRPFPRCASGSPSAAWTIPAARPSPRRARSSSVSRRSGARSPRRARDLHRRGCAVPGFRNESGTGHEKASVAGDSRAGGLRNQLLQGIPRKRMKGLEPSTFCMPNGS